MQEFFFESTLMIGFIGLVLAGIVGFFWTQLGQRALLYSAIGIAVATVLLILLSIQVKTDREKIRIVMNEVAEALRRNDRDRVYNYIHPNAVEALRRAKAELPSYEFRDARITRVKSIEINQVTTPPTAIAEFNVFVHIEAYDQVLRIPRFLKVYFMLKDGRWLVRDYEHYEPTAGFRDTSNLP